jgi:uncharacterized protein
LPALSIRLDPRLRRSYRAWPVANFAEASLERFAPVIARGDVESCCSDAVRGVMVPPALRNGLRTGGIVLDAMDTGAACRTYNVLLRKRPRPRGAH